MSFQVINTANDLLIYDVANDNVNYYAKSGLTVSVLEGMVRVINTDSEGNTNLAMNTRYTDVTAPSSTSAYDLATQIYGYINSSGGSLNSTQVVLTSAQILAMNSTPITLVTGIAGIEIQVVSAAMHLKWNSVAYATNTTLAIGTTSNPDDQAELNCLAATSDIKGTFGLLTDGTSANMHTGENLVVSVSSGNPVNGNSQVVVDVLYRVTDMP
jgi:hypothetical protein